MTRRSFLTLPFFQLKQQKEDSKNSFLLDLRSESLEIKYRQIPIEVNYLDKNNNILDTINFTIVELYRIIRHLKVLGNKPSE